MTAKKVDEEKCVVCGSQATFKETVEEQGEEWVKKRCTQGHIVSVEKKLNEEHITWPFGLPYV